MRTIAMTTAQADRFLELAGSLTRQPFESMRQVKTHNGTRPTWQQLQARCGQLSLIQSEILMQRHSR